jgi:hypothetical protein
MPYINAAAIERAGFKRVLERDGTPWVYRNEYPPSMGITLHLTKTRGIDPARLRLLQIEANMWGAFVAPIDF